MANYKFLITNTVEVESTCTETEIFQEIKELIGPEYSVRMCKQEKEKKSLTREVIDYLYKDEKKHFEECGDNPNDHIFLKLKRLSELI